MPRIVRAHQGDTVDIICQRAYGRTDVITEQVLRLNPGLADKGPILPQGTAVRLPDAPPDTRRQPSTIKLWD